MTFMDRLLGRIVSGQAKDDSSLADRLAKGVSPASLMLALEPRFMFDAAGVATGLEAEQEEASQNAVLDFLNDTPDADEALVLDHASLFDAPAPSSEVLFIAPDVDDPETLIASLGAHVDVVYLQSGQDALSQMRAALDGRSNLSALHVLSHGESGEVYLGDTVLSAETMERHTDSLKAIGESLSAGGDILFYGCDVAEGDKGQAFVQAFSEALSADVAASDDVTGNAADGGDWQLEYHVGQVETARLFTAESAWGYEDTLAVITEAADAPGDSSTTYTVANGDQFDGGIGLAGDVDYVRVTIDGGGRYSFSVTGNGGTPLATPQLTLYQTDGTTFMLSDSGATASFEQDFAVGDSGTYFLRIEDTAGTETGDYTLTVDMVDDEQVEGIGTALSLAVGGSEQGYIEDNGDRDWYEVTLDGGAIYQFDMRGTPTGGGSLANPYLRLYDAAGTPLGVENDDGGLGNDSRITRTFTIANGGTYYVEAGSSGDTGIGSYLVELSMVDDEQDENASTARVLNVGSTQEGYIEQAGDVDYFEMTLDGGATYRFDAYASGAGAATYGSLADSYIEVRNSSDVVVWSSDGGGAGNDARITGAFTIAEAGDYYLRVEGNGGTGAYTVGLEFVDDEPTAGIATSRTLAVGGTEEGYIEQNGDVDYFEMTLNGGATYQFDAFTDDAGAGNGTLVNSYIEVRDSTNTIVWTSDTGGAGADARITGQLAVADGGTYYLVVREPDNVGIGSYTVGLELVDDEPTAGTGTARTIAIDGSAAGYIEVNGDVDWFAVTLTQGLSYQFDLRSDGAAGTITDPHMYLYHSNGSTLLAEDDNAGSGSDSRVTYTATYTGTHYFRADQDGNGTGSYTAEVTLNDDEKGAAGAVTAGLATGESVTVDAAAYTGEIEGPEDVDYISVILAANQDHHFTLTGALSGATFELRNGSDSVVATGTNGYISYNPSSAGTYYLRVYGNGNAGTFSLSAKTDDTGNVRTLSTNIADVSGTPDISGTLEVGPDVDYYSVTLQAGFGYDFEVDNVSGALGTLRLTLYNSSGAVLDSATDGSDFRYIVGSTGTYYIGVQGDPLGTASQGVTTYDVHISNPDDEPREDVTTVEDLNAAAGLDGTASGNIDNPGDTDWYEVLLHNGVIYQLEMQSGVVDSIINLYNSSGVLVGTDNNSGVGNNSLLTFEATYTGSYYLEADANGAWMGAYDLFVTASDIPGSDVATAATLTADGYIADPVATPPTSTEYQIGINSDVDYFHLDMASDTSYAIRLTEGTLSNSRVRLWDETNSIWIDLTTDPRVLNYVSGQEFDIAANLFVDAADDSIPAELYLVVDTSTGSNVGTYDLEFYQTEDNPASDRSTATLTLTDNAGTFEDTLDYSGDVDWFLVTGGSGYVTITVEPNEDNPMETSITDTYLELYTISGSPIINSSDDNSGAETTPMLDSVYAGGGSFYIAVRAGLAAPDGTGNFRIVVSEAADPPPPGDNIPGNATTSEVLEIYDNPEDEVGSKDYHSEMDYYGDVDWFQVQLVEGRLYSFKQTGLYSGGGSLEEGYLVLYNRMGAQILASGTGGVSDDPVLEWRATGTDTYFIGVMSEFNATIGTYTLSAEWVTDGPDSIAFYNAELPTVPENSPANTYIGDLVPGQWLGPVGGRYVEMTDDDYIYGDTYTYELDPDDPFSAYFQIDADGRMTLTEEGSLNLDFETASSVSVGVRVIDAYGNVYPPNTPEPDNLPTFQQVTIGITDANDPPTGISLNSGGFDLSENLNGEIVGLIGIIDQDGDSGAGDTHIVTLIETYADSHMFEIVVNPSGHPDGMYLKLKDDQAFDYEAGPNFYVGLRAEDSAGAVLTNYFTLVSWNVDEAPTDITLDNATVHEHADVGYTFGVITGSDPDLTPSQDLTFTVTGGDLINGNPATDYFEAFEDNGVWKLRVIAVPYGAEFFDYEQLQSTDIEITVEDPTGQTTSDTFTITIQNENEVPTDIALTDPDFNEMATIGTLFGNLSMTDTDGAAENYDDLTFEVVGGTTINGSAATDLFEAVEVSEGVWRLRIKALPSGGFDHESLASFSLDIRVTDSNIDGAGSGALTRQESFTIDINDVNDAPTAIALDANEWDENAAAGTPIGTLTTTDPDAPDNDNLASDFTYSIANASTVYTNLNGTDYTIGELFEIVGDELRLHSSLPAGFVFDFEDMPENVDISITSTDSGWGGSDPESKTETFSLTMLNKNENLTEITLSNTDLQENSNEGTVIGTISNDDPDARDQGAGFTYTIANPTDVYCTVEGVTYTNADLFEIVGNELRVISAFGNGDGAIPFPGFDFETMPATIDVDIQAVSDEGAWDGSTSGDTQTITLDLKDENEAATSLHFIDGDHTVDVMENPVDGLLVGKVHFTDQDTVPTYIEQQFSVIASGQLNDGSAVFAIDPDTGWITVIDPDAIDQELVDDFTVRVRAVDANDPTNSDLWTEQDFTINVRDMNESPTQFRFVSYVLPGNPPIGTVVADVSIVGADPSGYDFEIVGGDGMGLFDIEYEKTGLIKTVAAIDLIAQDMYTVTVRATNVNDPTDVIERDFSIDLEMDSKTGIDALYVTPDTADPANLTVTNVSFDENSPVGTVIGTLLAVDDPEEDSPRDRDVHFFLSVVEEDIGIEAEDGSPLKTNDLFECAFNEDNRTWELKVKTLPPDGFDYESFVDYPIKILAEEYGVADVLFADGVPITADISESREANWYMLDLSKEAFYELTLTDSSAGGLEFLVYNDAWEEVDRFPLATDDTWPTYEMTNAPGGEYSSAVYYIGVRAVDRESVGINYSLTFVETDDYLGDSSSHGKIEVDADPTELTIHPDRDWDGDGPGGVEPDTDWLAVDMLAGTFYQINAIADDPANLTVNIELFRYDDGAGDYVSAGMLNDGDILETQSWLEGETVFLSFTSAVLGELGGYTASVQIVDDYFASEASEGEVEDLTGDTTGIIERATDQDWFKIDLQEASYYELTVDTSDPSYLTAADLTFEIYEFLDDEDDATPPYVLIDTITPSTVFSTDTYDLDTYIAVTGSAAGEYHFTFTHHDDFAASKDSTGEVEVNAYGTAPEDYVSAAGVIDQAGDKDWFEAPDLDGYHYTVNIDSDDIVGDFLVKIYGEDDEGNRVLVWDPGTAGRSWQFAALGGGFGDKEPYFFEVETQDGVSLGAYTLTVTLIDDVSSFTVPGSASAGEDATTWNIDVLGDSDWFEVSVMGGSYYSVDVDSTGFSDFKIWLFGVDSDNNVAFNTELTSGVIIDTDGYDSELAYYVGVWDDTATEIGSYSISFQQHDDHVASTEALEVNALDGSVDGRIDLNGDQDWFAVSLLEATYYEIELDGTPEHDDGTPFDDPYGDSDLRIAVYDENGTFIYNVPFTNGLLTTFDADPIGEGDYFLSVESISGTGTGHYSLSIKWADDYLGSDATNYQIAVGEEDYPDEDEEGGAPPVEEGDEVILEDNFYGSLDVATDEDWFKITLQDSLYYKFGFVSYTGSLTDLNLDIYDSSSNFVMSVARGDILYANALGDLPADDYFAVISSASGTQVGDYSVNVTRVDDYSASTALPGDVTLESDGSGRIERAGDEDWFTVGLELGLYYYFDFDSANIANETLSLYDGTGTFLMSLDAGEVFDTVSSGMLDGVYYVGVATSDPTEQGTYTISFHQDDDFAQGVGSATSVKPAEVISGTLEREDDQDWLSVDMKEGLYYQLDISTAGLDNPLADPILEILDETGALVSGITNTLRPGDGSFIVKMEDHTGDGDLAPGKYYLAVRSESDVNIGDYTVEFNLVDDYSEGDALMGELDPHDPDKMTLSGSIQHGGDGGDEDWFTVTLPEDTRLEITVDGDPTDPNALEEVEFVFYSRTIDDPNAEEIVYNLALLDTIETRRTVISTFRAGGFLPGEIIIAVRSPDPDATGNYTISIKDLGRPSVEEAIDVEVRDVNESPIDLNITDGAKEDTVNELAANGDTAVDSLDTTDIDIHRRDVHQYTIDTIYRRDGSIPADDYFAIDAATGTITVTADAVFDHENPQNNIFTLDITAADTDDPTLLVTKTLTIRITDDNEAPTEVNITASDIGENEADGTVIGLLSAVDADLITDIGDPLNDVGYETSDRGYTDSFTYQVVGGTGEDFFDVSDGKIILTDTSGINFEVQDTYTLDVMVTDAAGNTFTETLTINITDQNDVPVVSVPLSDWEAIEEINFTDSFADNFNFTDEDVGNAAGNPDFLTYSVKLKNGDDLPDWLSFDPATRTFDGMPGNNDIVRARGYLDIRVTATDLDGTSASDVFRLVLTDTNDQPYILTAAPDEVLQENDPFLIDMSKYLVDMDWPDSLTFSLDSSAPSWLSLSSDGHITGTAERWAAGDDYTLTVRATDTRGTFITDTFVISVWQDPESGVSGGTTEAGVYHPINQGAVLSGSLTLPTLSPMTDIYFTSDTFDDPVSLMGYYGASRFLGEDIEPLSAVKRNLPDVAALQREALHQRFVDHLTGEEAIPLDEDLLPIEEDAEAKDDISDVAPFLDQVIPGKLFYDFLPDPDFIDPGELSEGDLLSAVSPDVTHGLTRQVAWEAGRFEREKNNLLAAATVFEEE